MHIDEYTLEASPHGHSPTSVDLVAAEFLPFPQVRTKNKKANVIQTTVYPTPQFDHPDSVVEVNGPISDSPLFTLASISVKFLKASALEPASPSA